ncbi:MAG TPA: hypothetical protein VF526_00105 [Solirubrobacteraceae bacterium]|jgi:hypothetical protein
MTNLMSSTRALFASIGAGASLVAAAALALLVVGAVIAFGGSGGNLRSASPKPAFVLHGSAGRASGISAARADGRAPILLRARAGHKARRPRLMRAQVKPAPVASPVTPVVAQPSIRSAPAVAAVPQEPAAPVRSGDTVRRVGDGIGSAVQKTATTLEATTAPLGPPVSQAVQDVLDRVAIQLKRTTDGLAGTLDKVLPPKK